MDRSFGPGNQKRIDMTENFELSEFLQSATAKELGIDNFPSFDVVLHLYDLTSKILQPVRTAWGSAINVTSGFRCDELNEAVGGSDTSVHKIGYAADLQPANGRFKDFVNFTINYLFEHGIKFDQILIETSGNTRWLHIGLYNNAGQQRGIVRTMTV